MLSESGGGRVRIVGVLGCGHMQEVFVQRLEKQSRAGAGEGHWILAITIVVV